MIPCCEQLVVCFFLKRVPFYKNRNKKNISRDWSFWDFWTSFRIGLVSSFTQGHCKRYFQGLKRWQMLDWPWHGASINRSIFPDTLITGSQNDEAKRKHSGTTFEEIITLFNSGNNYFLWWLKLQQWAFLKEDVLGQQRVAIGNTIHALTTSNGIQE